MANRFLNNITINDSYTFPNADGTADQIIKTDGVGQLNFINQSSLAAGSSESVHILVKNTSGSQIAKGTPVYVTSETGNSGKIEIAPADASDEDKMPALGLLETTLNHNAEGYCVQGGLLDALATATIDGTSTTANDTVYIKAGGGLTMTKPTGTNFIQNIAKVARVHASNGSLVVSSILRTNDVPTPLYIDHANQRLGIGVENPLVNFQVGDGTADDSARVYFSDGNYTEMRGYGLQFSRSASYIRPTADNTKNLYLGTDAAQWNTLSIDASTTTFNTNGSENMRIDSNGNVGINTINPNQKLTIRGNDNYVATEQTSYAWGAANTIGVKLGTSTAGVLDFRRWDGGVTHGTALITQVSSDGGWGLDFRVDNKSTNTAATSSRMFLSTSGEVGIGTTNPIAKLHVSGSQQFILIESTANSDAAYRSKTTLGYYGSGTGIGSATDCWNVYDFNAGSERMRISSSGNVGIGDANPDAKLTVFRADSTYAVNLSDTESRAGLSVKSSSNFDSKLTISSGASSRQYIQAANNSATVGRDISINPYGGNVGIGTDNPGAKLEVNGTVDLDNLTINGAQGGDGQVLTSTGTGIAWEDASGSGGGISGTIAAGQVAFGTGTDTIGGDGTTSVDGLMYNSAQNQLTTGSLVLSNGIFHTGNLVTAVQFSFDQIDFYAGGLKMITCDEGATDEVIINQDSNDINFRVESNTYTHMFFVDGGLNRVGINNNNPGYTLDINGNANIATTLRVGGNINGQAGIEGESLTINTGPSTITGELDKDGSKITNLANPTSAQDAATKAYVDSQSGGGGTTYSINAGAKSGNNVPINLDAASGTDTLINLTQGTGITLTRNSSNQITIEASGGGGGSSTLSGLSDVTISSLQNNDLLMYNGTASEWQNTNLGLTVTPTLSGASTGYATLQYTLTVSNHATYDDPAYYVEVYNTSGSVVVANSAITNNYDGTFTFTLPSAAASYTIQVRAQDFGDLQSEIATKTITVSQLSLNYRYFRVTNFTGTAKTSVMIRDFRLYTSAGQSGTQLPPNMTSNTAPTPYVASGQGQYSASYDPYKAFDSSASSQWWNLSGNNTTDYLQIDLGQAYTIKSFRFREGSTTYGWTGCTVQASNTGAFNGEEFEVVLTGLTALYPSYKNAG